MRQLTSTRASCSKRTIEEGWLQGQRTARPLRSLIQGHPAGQNETGQICLRNSIPNGDFTQDKTRTIQKERPPNCGYPLIEIVVSISKFILGEKSRLTCGFVPTPKSADMLITVMVSSGDNAKTLPDHRTRPRLRGPQLSGPCENRLSPQLYHCLTIDPLDPQRIPGRISFSLISATEDHRIKQKWASYAPLINRRIDS